ncbi:hypothetical protein VNI00_016246 [Paramarasmius palmivorus]|uniref:Uncharacterized protein n=1 Tax=Paramarasmius palmivorus TaxID=297713 RepID=A0AAW0BEM5_9AGAR
MDTRPRKPKNIQISHSVFIAETGENLSGGIGLSASIGTTAITSGNLPIEMKAKLLSAKFNSMSTRLFFVHCKAVAEYSPEYFVRDDVHWKEQIKILNTEGFRERYGDYYVAGCRYRASCEILILCQMHDDLESRQLQIEARAHLWSVLQGGVSVESSRSNTGMSEIVDHTLSKNGCSTSALGDNVVQSIPAVLENLLQNAHGEKEVAYLKHYSTLNPNIPCETEAIRVGLFRKLDKIDAYYKALQDFMDHPASRRSNIEYTKIKQAVDTYKFDQQNPARPDVHELWTSSSEAEAKLEELMKLKVSLEASYELMQAMKHIDISRRLRTSNGARREFRWECGKQMRDLVGTPGNDEQGYHCVTFRSGHRAYWAEWTTHIAPRRTFALDPDPQYMEFRTKVCSPTKKMASLVRTSPIPGGNKESGPLKYEWTGEPVYILGWSLSARGFKKEPKITVDGEQSNNCILSDYLSIELDTSTSAYWKCQVMFVLQHSHTFPDLFARGKEAAVKRPTKYFFS